MSYNEILLCIAGLALVSYIPRILPFAILGNRELPEFFHKWLQYVPTAVFGALIFSSIFVNPAGGFNFNTENKEMIASIFVLMVAAKTKSLAYSIITGLVVYWSLQQLLQ